MASVLFVKFWLTMAQGARRTQIPPVLTNICVHNDDELVSMFERYRSEYFGNGSLFVELSVSGSLCVTCCFSLRYVMAYLLHL